MDIRNKKVTIIGAARSGIAAANLVLEMGGVPKVTDAKPLNEIERNLAQLKDKTKTIIEAGGHTAAFVQDSDLVVASPGVWKDALPLQWARDKGIPVMGEIEFAWKFCQKPVIAVTGSNGKTTTVSLIASVLEAWGKKACLCGNVGIPFSQCVFSQDVDFFVVEISSFQLELIETFRPYIAVMLNLSQNHLNRHPDMQDYYNAKKRLFMNQSATDYAVLNAQDDFVRRLENEVGSEVRLFGERNDASDPNQLAVFAVAQILGVPDKLCRRTCSDFKAIEHRMESVCALRGVEYINDSKATTVESVRYALNRIPGDKIYLICGGSDKGLDYSSLRDLFKSKVKKLILLTRDDVSKKKIHGTFDGIVPIEDHEDMVQAIRSVRKQAQSCEKVLFSPMFASFDMFDDYEQRGRIFKGIVNGL